MSGRLFFRLPLPASISLELPPELADAPPQLDERTRNAPQCQLSGALADDLLIARQHVNVQLAQGRRVLAEWRRQRLALESSPRFPAARLAVAVQDSAPGFLNQHGASHHVPQSSATDDGQLERTARRIGQLVGDAARRTHVESLHLGAALHAVLLQHPPRRAGEARAFGRFRAGCLHGLVIAEGAAARVGAKNRAVRSLPRHRNNAQHRHTAKTKAHGDGKGRQAGGKVRRAVEGSRNHR